jgi:hypothetical protein
MGIALIYFTLHFMLPSISKRMLSSLWNGPHVIISRPELWEKAGGGGGRVMKKMGFGKQKYTSNKKQKE